DRRIGEDGAHGEPPRAGAAVVPSRPPPRRTWTRPRAPPSRGDRRGGAGMSVRVVLVDLNAKMVAAWRAAFGARPGVEVGQGSILAQRVDAWVTPTNARGKMDGGVDAAIRRELGAAIEKRVQKAIAAQYSGSMPVGYATCVPTGRVEPAWLISTPTMA